MTESEKTVTKTFTKMKAAHIAVRFAASTSVKMVIGTAIAQYVPTETKAQKLKLCVGTYVISGMVSDAAKTFASRELDEAVELASILIQKIKDDAPKTANDNPTE